MTGLPCFGILLLITISSLALADGQVLNQDQEIDIHDLPALMARSPRADVLLTSLDTVFHDRKICCGKDSALEDSAEAANPRSLQDVATKLQGRHLLSDGRPIMVSANYFTSDALNSGFLISWFQDHRAALMQWNSRIYVIHGIVYLWTAGSSPDGSSQPAETVIHKFLLWDTRFSDARREVVFDRTTDDLGKVEGFLFVKADPQ